MLTPRFCLQFCVHIGVNPDMNLHHIPLSYGIHVGEYTPANTV